MQANGIIGMQHLSCVKLLYSMCLNLVFLSENLVHEHSYLLNLVISSPYYYFNFCCEY